MISTQDAAKLLNVSTRQVRYLCEAGRVAGAKKVGKAWVLPDKPVVLAIRQAHMVSPFANTDRPRTYGAESARPAPRRQPYSSA